MRSNGDSMWQGAGISHSVGEELQRKVVHCGQIVAESFPCALIKL